MPLVELSPGARTDPAVTARLQGHAGGHRQGAGGVRGAAGLHRAAHPGAGHERGGAHGGGGRGRAEDIDKAIKYGFGFRYAVLGMLEFIDYGGGDILYYASRYLTEALGDPRYAAPAIIERNMREGRIGLKTGKGFLDYDGLDIEAYRSQRLKALVDMLGFLGLTRPPVLPD